MEPMDELCNPGTWGAEFFEGFDPEPGEQVIVKNRFSGFVDTSLELFLRANGIHCVVLAGLTTTSSIDATARDSAMRDYQTVVVGDCTSDLDFRIDFHDAVLKLLNAVYAPILTLDAISQAW